MRRRDFLAVPVALGGWVAMSGTEITDSMAMAAQSHATGASPLGVKALVFDTFGTVVDWRGSIIREATEWEQAKTLQIDWGKFADQWRAGYGPSMDKVRKGALPWMKLDDLHRLILDDLLKQYNITGLSEVEKWHWNTVWHRLSGWPDAVEGLTRLKKNFVIATLSNGNVSLLVEMAKFAGLPWDTVFGSDLFHHFKPDREVYLGAVDLLGYKASEVMMVAAHPLDLNAAKALGLKAGYVPRPLEGGPDRKPTPPTAEALAQFDVVAADFVELSAKLS
ncbi:MAG TPA: haloacid dehalogenase type II [Candidatus Acidoferrales bacterium]|jgi:2-haloacid dehalogenase|nr:haloacid dehalogenase type II [Candidatus Acidoferrales bacterium]